jgi:predicted membrane protein DUF2306
MKMKSQIVGSQKPGLLKKIGWVVMLLLATLVFLFASRYLTLDPDVFFSEQRAVYMAHITMLIMHIVGAMLAILIGPFQFLPGIRKGRWLKVHRWLGRTYLLSVLVGGIGGLYMAPFAYGGIISRLGFGALGCLWLYSGYQAYRHIRNKEIEVHRQWMIRNYALTFAGVMLRLWVPLSGAIGIDFTTAYVMIGWMCWVPNLLVAEWIIRSTRPARRPAATLETSRTAQNNLSYEGD